MQLPPPGTQTVTVVRTKFGPLLTLISCTLFAGAAIELPVDEEAEVLPELGELLLWPLPQPAAIASDSKASARGQSALPEPMLLRQEL
jgi:hypothetical protein